MFDRSNILTKYLRIFLSAHSFTLLHVYQQQTKIKGNMEILYHTHTNGEIYCEITNNQNILKITSLFNWKLHPQFIADCI